MQFVFNQKVIIGNQEKNNTYIKKTSKIKGKRYVAREKMNFRFSHPLLFKSRKILKNQGFLTFSLFLLSHKQNQGIANWQSPESLIYIYYASASASASSSSSGAAAYSPM